MEEMEIVRKVDGRTVVFVLTPHELETAYRIRQKEYLEEDFANSMPEPVKAEGQRFNSGHLEEFPELMDWIYAAYVKLFDSEMGDSDLRQMVLRKLDEESRKSSFFKGLVSGTKAVCRGYCKELDDCEKKCATYYHCSNIAEANDRCRRWEDLAALMYMHKAGNCSCLPNRKELCLAAKYLDGDLDFGEFYHALDKEEC